MLTMRVGMVVVRTMAMITTIMKTNPNRTTARQVLHMLQVSMRNKR